MTDTLVKSSKEKLEMLIRIMIFLQYMPKHNDLLKMHSYSSRITEASPSYKLFKYHWHVEPFYVMQSSSRK